MGSFIAQQPNGLYCRFSTIVDTVTHYNMTKDHSLKEECGVFTLQDIIGKLPRHINDFGTKNKLHIEPTFAGPWCISYQIGICEPFVFKLSGNLLDAAYDMLCWCIENGYVKVGKEE